MNFDKNLEDGDGECGSFSSTRLCLCNHVSSLDDWLDCTLLDGGRLLKTISIDAPENNLIEEKSLLVLNSHLSRSSLSAMESKVGMTSTSSLVSNSTLARSSSSTPRLVSFDAILVVKRNLEMVQCQIGN